MSSGKYLGRFLRLAIASFAFCCAVMAAHADDPSRIRIIIETDAGGDPDDEQSLVRFLLYANEWDVEGIIANRPQARDGENKNPERTGLGIVRRQLAAYGQCWTNLVRHDSRYPTLDTLWSRTVAGYDNTSDAVKLIIKAVDSPDPRPVWYGDWGTDHGSSTNNLRRALDLILRERGTEGYAKFKSRLRLSSADPFADHLTKIDPPFVIWVDTFRPPMDGKRWYHRFSALTAKAGGFDIERDARTGHGPLGAVYPLNTTHPQKEGDTMSFLYLFPTGMNDPMEPTWGSWAGRYGSNTNFPGRNYFWASELDTWNGVTNRDNTLARWAVAIQNDFRARLEWCVMPNYEEANHPPVAVLNGDKTKSILKLNAKSGESVKLSAVGSSDPDHQALKQTWFIYREAGTFRGEIELERSGGLETSFVAPRVESPATIHVILQVEDEGNPSLFAYRRAVVTIRP